jgi:hypothetical protein
MPPSFACLGPKRKDRIFDCDGECDIQTGMNAMLPHAELKPHKLTVDNLLLLDRGGAFVGIPRVELLDGTLYEMSPQTSPHVRVRNRLKFRLQSRIVEAETITQFWSAQGDAYENECVVAFGERLTSTTIPGLQIETDRLI